MEDITSDTEDLNCLDFIVLDEENDSSGDNSVPNNVEVDVGDGGKCATVHKNSRQAIVFDLNEKSSGTYQNIRDSASIDRKSRRKEDSYGHSHRSRYEQVRSHSDRDVRRSGNRFDSREHRSHNDSRSRSSGGKCDLRKESGGYVPRRHSEDYHDKRSKREVPECRRDIKSTEKKIKETDEDLIEKKVESSHKEKNETKNENLKCKEQEIGAKSRRDTKSTEKKIKVADKDLKEENVKSSHKEKEDETKKEILKCKEQEVGAKSRRDTKSTEKKIKEADKDLKEENVKSHKEKEDETKKETLKCKEQEVGAKSRSDTKSTEKKIKEADKDLKEENVKSSHKEKEDETKKETLKCKEQEVGAKSRSDTKSTEKKIKEADKDLKEENVKSSHKEKEDETKKETLKCKEQEVGAKSRRDTKSTEKEIKEADKDLKEENEKPNNEKKDETKNEKLECKEQEMGEKVIKPVTDRITLVEKDSSESKKKNACNIVLDESFHKGDKIEMQAETSKCKEGENFKPFSNAAEDINKNPILNQSSCLDQTLCDGKAANQDMATSHQGKTITDVLKTKEPCNKSWMFSSEEQRDDNKFQKIAILSHPDYGDHLKRLNNSKVKLFLDDTLSIDNVLDVIQKNMADVGNNALWILITGIYSVVDVEPYHFCRNCSQPLFYILPNKDFTFETDINLSIDTRLAEIERYLDIAQYVLGTSGILVIAPPLPAVVIKTAGLNHSKLHKKVRMGASITKNNNFAEIEGVYNMYCTAMTTLSCNIIQRWINPKDFYNFENKSSKSNVNRQYVRKLWYETMEALFESVLNQPYPNEDIRRWVQAPYVFDQVVIVGLTEYTGLLQSMTEEMPVIFLDETLDLDENGLKVLHHLKTRWPSRTLWIVMVGISELAWPVDSMSLCSYVNCENQLPTFITKNHELGSEAFRGISNERMVDIIVDSAFDFAARASINIGDGSALLMAPFIPQMGIYAGISCTESHEMLHMLFERNRDVPFFVGSIDTWMSCADYLDYKWLSYIKNTFYNNSMPLRLIGKYAVEKNCLLTFINSASNIDGPTIRHKWSKLMVELIDYFLHCKMNSSLPFKTSHVSQPPTANTDYRRLSGNRPRQWESCSIPDSVQHALIGTSQQPTPELITVPAVPAIPVDPAIPFVPPVQTSIHVTHAIPTLGPLPPSHASMSQPPLSHASISQPPLSHASMSQPPLSQASISQPPLSHASMSKLPLSHASLSQLPPSHASMAQPPPSHASMAQPPSPSHASVAQPPPSHASMAQPPPSYASMAQLPPSHASMAQLPPSHASMAQLPPSYASMAQLPPSHASVAQPLPSHISMAQPLPSHASCQPLPSHASMAQPPPSHASVSQPPPSTYGADYTAHFAPPCLPVVSTPSAAKNALPLPISFATSLSTSAIPQPSPLTSNMSQKGCIVIENIESEMNFGEATELLKHFGKIEDITWPSKGNVISGTLIMVTYEDSTHAETAARILSFLKVFGANSTIKLIGKEDDLKLQQEDLTILMKVHDFMKKDKDTKNQNQTEDSPKIDWSEKVPLIDSKPNVSLPSSLESIPLPKGDIEVTFMYGGDLVPVESINQFFLGLGAVKEGVSVGGKIVYHFKTYCAELELLKILRFPDKIAEVQVPKPKKVVTFSKDEMAKAAKKFHKFYSTIMAPIEELLKSKIKKEINIYTFKTELCEWGSTCKEKGICPGYHNNEDRRRCPLTYKYSADMCLLLLTHGFCDAKDSCLKAHSSYEKLFHFHRYKNSLCKTEEQKGSCKDAQKLCYSAHKGEPDMFYHDKWKHLYVEGLGKTLCYLRGAIMNLFKFPNLKCPRVLLVTPSKVMATLYFNCISDYAASCGLRAGKLNSNSNSGEDADVIITTLKSLLSHLKLHKSDNHTKEINVSKLKALIIDDGPGIFGSLDEYNKTRFKSFGNTLRELNVVITAEKLIDSEIATAKESLNFIDFLKCRSTNLKEESPSISQKEPSRSMDDSSKSSASASIKRSKSSSSRSPKRSKSQSSSSSTRVPSTTRSPSKSNSQSIYRSKSSRSSEKFRSQSSKVKPHRSETDEIGKDIHRKLLKCGSQSKDKLSRQDGNPSRKRKLSNVSVDQSKSRLPKKIDDGKSSILEERRAELVKAIEELTKEHDKELKLFTEAPEIHPSYEKSYSDFIEKYKEDYPGSNDISHTEKLWKDFWEITIKELLKQEYKSKFKNQCESLTAEIWYLEKQNKERDRKSPEKTIFNKEQLFLTDERKSPEKTIFNKEELFLTDEGEDVDLDNLLQLKPSAIPQSKEKVEIAEKMVTSADKVEIAEKIVTSADKIHEAKEKKNDANKTKYQKELNQTEFLLSKSSEMEEVPWWMHSLTVLSDACASLGPPVSSLLKVHVEKLLGCGPDKNSAKKLRVDKDNVLILEAISEELKKKGNSNGPDCQNFKLASYQAMKLLEFQKVVLEGQEELVKGRDEELNIQYPSIKTQGKIEEPSFDKSSAGKILGCKRMGRLSTNIKIERKDRMKTGPLRKSNKEGIPSQEEQNTEKSLEQIFSELDCLKNTLVLLQKMEPEFQVLGYVASMLVTNMQKSWSDRSKLCAILREADTQSFLKQISAKANILAEDTPNAYAAEKFYEKALVAKKLFDLSRAITSKMDSSLRKESSEEGLHSTNSARISSEDGIFSTCSQGKFSSTSPTAVCSNSSQPPQSNLSSQTRFSNCYPPTKSKERPVLSKGPSESAGVKKTYASTDLSIHSTSSKVHGLDEARSSDGGSSCGLPQDVSVTDKDFSSLEEICLDVGLLGPFALELFKEIRACWPDRAKVTEILSCKEKKDLLELISGKARKLSEEATSESCKIKYQLASINISKLLDFRESFNEKEKYLGLDVNKMARMTFNKGSHFTAQYIKSALFLEGIVNPSEEDLTRIFEAVIGLHFSMAVS
ncbi:uncharacterized protein [Palaemon carinicauda]|uniref:uncharacterized protein n=1 Tax=Palaemon carinicauda TaxID=392227 RepID=UPI0035B64CE5